MEITENQNNSQASVNPNAAKKPVIKDLLPIKLTPQLKIVLLISGIVFLLLIITSLVLRKNTNLTNTYPSPSINPDSSAALPPREVSEFAKGQPFLDFEQKLTDYRQKLQTADLNESSLSFPLLDMNVNYRK